MQKNVFSYFICFVSLQFLSYVYTYLVKIKSALLAKLTFKKWPVNYLPSVYFQQRYFFHEFQEWEHFFQGMIIISDMVHTLEQNNDYLDCWENRHLFEQIYTLFICKAYFKELQMNLINLSEPKPKMVFKHLMIARN